MAITAFTGVPGSGKSYALIEQVILPAVLNGRRVLTNVEGVNPQLVEAYCADRATDPEKVGSVVIFDGQDALKAGFFPTETISDETTVLKAGDYLVFDEWRLYWPRRGKMPSPDLEPFLRWHRHLVSPSGQSTDVAIGTQLATDISGDFRGLIERSYKFRKLKALGRPKNYAWDVFEGHLQPKGGQYAQGLGTYKPEVFALYKSYAGADGSENNNDKRLTIFNKWFVALGVLVVLLLIGGIGGALRFFTASTPKAVSSTPAPPGSVAPGQPGGPAVSSVPPLSPWRIVGTVGSSTMTRVVLLSSDGTVRIVGPDGFTFSEGRPQRGMVDGQEARADDRVEGMTSPIAQVLP